ncbi:MAG: Ig-like domain-containing protein, partial [Clostridiales bacterium]|nr:Ig-like domain-containing protein [Clostridiales bacterium]
AITVYEDEKPPVEAVTITNINDNNHIYETAGGIVIHFHFYLPEDMIGKYKKEKIEVEVKKNGVVDEAASVFNVEAPDQPIHMHVKVSGAMSDVDTTKYEITFNWKNDDGDVVMTGVFTKAPPKTLIINETLNLTLKDDETVTGTVEATISSTVEGEISWSIDDEDVATIAVSEDKMSVTVTAVAKGTATITATVDGLTQTCTVNVLNEGEKPTITVVNITNVMDPQDVFDLGDGKFAIHFYFMLGDYGLAGKVALDNMDVSVTHDGEDVEGVYVGPNSSIGGDNSCHIHAAMPGTKAGASGTYVITFKFKNADGDVIAQGTFTKTI